MAKLEEVEGIGEVYAAKLQAAGVKDTEELLEVGGTPKGRQDLAEKSGVSEKLILEWVNHVDLFRIQGIGSEYADLLEEAGVDTVVELAQRTAANVHAKLQSINVTKKLVRRLPTPEQIADWIEQAKKLPRAITY
jgi:predicted flap endonuclease-1-like 5' DNA nuclease